MAKVGSYIRSLQERAGSGEIDDQAAIGQVLKQVGKATQAGRDTVAFSSLIASTGLPEDTVRMAVDYLLRSHLLEGEYDNLSLTDLGYRAQFVVAS